MASTSKYIAIKVAGLSYWLWFEREQVTEEDGWFTGRNGWGLDGAFTDINISVNELAGRIESEELQYR